MKNMTMYNWIALALKLALAVVVGAFLGRETMNFANFIFPADQWYFAYSVFGLTMGAFIVYLYLLLKDAETPLQKTVALTMTMVGLLGELATAGFGMQIEGWKNLGWHPTPSEFDFMVLVIRIMLFIHGIALVLYWFGDRIFEIIEEASGKDINRDGRIGKSNNSSRKPANDSQKPNNAPNPQNAPQHTLDEFLRVTGLTREQARAKYADRDAFMQFASGQFDYISGGNMRRLHVELMNGSQPQKVNP